MRRQLRRPLLDGRHDLRRWDNPVREVMIGGRRVVREGRHAAKEEIEACYPQTMARQPG